MEDKLYTTQEVANSLSVSDAHVRKMILQGKARPKQMIGHTWVFTLDELERLRNRPKSKGGRGKKNA